VLSIKVKGVNEVTGTETIGKLNLVDLAGSERADKSGVAGHRLKEAQCINSTLSAAPICDGPPSPGARPYIRPVLRERGSVLLKNFRCI
jgi:hypothetical protein